MTREDWGSNRPLLLAVDADFHQLSRIEAELSRAFGADYRVRGELSSEDALRTLHDADRRKERVAVVLVDETFSDDARSEIFAAARSLHRNARRALLIAWGAWARPGSAQKILRSMAIGDISYYVLKPWAYGDEFFHRTIAEFVFEWSRAEPTNFREVVVVAERHSGRAYEVSDLLSRNGIPHAFRAASFDGRTRGPDARTGVPVARSSSGCRRSVAPAWSIPPTPRSSRLGESLRFSPRRTASSTC